MHTLSELRGSSSEIDFPSRNERLCSMFRGGCRSAERDSLPLPGTGDCRARLLQRDSKRSHVGRVQIYSREQSLSLSEMSDTRVVLTKFSFYSLLIASLILDWTIAKLARHYLFAK